MNHVHPFIVLINCPCMTEILLNGYNHIWYPHAHPFIVLIWLKYCWKRCNMVEWDIKPCSSFHCPEHLYHVHPSIVQVWLKYCWKVMHYIISDCVLCSGFAATLLFGDKRAIMALYCSPKYHNTQGEYDNQKNSSANLFWNQALGLRDVV